MPNRIVNNANMRFVTLIMTHNCNLNCSYCYEHHKEQNSFDIELAKEIIQREANQDDSYSEICFDFFGGEPFLEFEKIREIVDFSKEQIFKKKVYFFAGTNGTLVNEEIQKWLMDNRDIFQVALSIDGTKEMHDINRSNSYDSIPIHFFSSKFKNLAVKATISPTTIDNLATGVIHLHELNFTNISCNLAVGVDWSSEKYISILKRELNQLIEYYLENPQIAPCNLLDYHIEYAAHPNNGKALKFCGAGTRTKVYDIDGKVYPCQYFLPLAIGKVAEEPLNFTFSDEINISDLDVNCQDCIAVNICPSCYGSNYQETGNIYERDKSFCKLQKVIILANSYFQAKKWEMGQLSLENYQEQELLHGIMKIQNNLRI